jgi:hypothetical protein
LARCLPADRALTIIGQASERFHAPQSDALGKRLAAAMPPGLRGFVARGRVPAPDNPSQRCRSVPGRITTLEREEHGQPARRLRHDQPVARARRLVPADHDADAGDQVGDGEHRGGDVHDAPPDRNLARDRIPARDAAHERKRAAIAALSVSVRCRPALIRDGGRPTRAGWEARSRRPWRAACAPRDGSTRRATGAVSYHRPERCPRSPTGLW